MKFLDLFHEWKDYKVLMKWWSTYLVLLSYNQHIIELFYLSKLASRQPPSELGHLVKKSYVASVCQRGCFWTFKLHWRKNKLDIEKQTNIVSFSLNNLLPLPQFTSINTKYFRTEKSPALCKMTDFI